jgi:SIR2-like domain
MATTGRVLLLGAGASRGANFGFPPDCEPPLNRDFFTQLQRITAKHTPLARSVIDDVVELFGSNFSLTLEDYFTQLEFLIATSEGFSSAADRKVAMRLKGNRDRLMAALSGVLEASTNRAISGSKARGCQHHRAIARTLTRSDHVISFNYDCIMDDALRREADGRWSAFTGYDFPPRMTVESSGALHWSPAGKPRLDRADTIRLLKLHGSVHWQLPGETSTVVKLKRRLHQQNGTPHFDIIPPQWNKSLAGPVFRRIWRTAYQAIERTDRIAIIGFSFTPTDLHVESLFRLALARTPLRTLVIANPSPADRERIRRVFASALARTKATVREYDGLSDLTSAWPACLDS